MTDRFQVDVRLDDETRFCELAEDVRRSLTSCPKFLLPKYFYDLAGSTLFDRITDLPEYYLTRAEASLLDQLAPDLMREVAPIDIVELGSGSSAKTRCFLEAGDGVASTMRYVPIDVDLETVAGASARLLKDYPALRVHAVVGDFERHLQSVPPPEGRRLVLFLGSTIGNLDPPARHALLEEVRQLLGMGDRFLLGVDLVKDIRVLEAAYNDAAGVTAAFNRNILRVVNRAVGGDFQPEQFRHLAFYNDSASRIEMHLVAEAAQVVRLRRLGLTVDLAPEERIFTESSYKFTRRSVEADLREARLRVERWHTDAEQRFALVLAARP
jgi:L-histidine N-alpha-methyltransferase